MLVTKPVRESWEQIKEKYKGYCVLVIQIEGSEVHIIDGEVAAFNESLADLVNETDNYIETTNIGVFAYKTLTGFDGHAMPIQIVYDEG